MSTKNQHAKDGSQVSSISLSAKWMVVAARSSSNSTGWSLRTSSRRFTRRSRCKVRCAEHRTERKTLIRYLRQMVAGLDLTQIVTRRPLARQHRWCSTKMCRNSRWTSLSWKTSHQRQRTSSVRKRTTIPCFGSEWTQIWSTLGRLRLSRKSATTGCSSSWESRTLLAKSKLSDSFTSSMKTWCMKFSKLSLAKKTTSTKWEKKF